MSIEVLLYLQIEIIRCHYVVLRGRRVYSKGFLSARRLYSYVLLLAHLWGFNLFICNSVASLHPLLKEDRFLLMCFKINATKRIKLYHNNNCSTDVTHFTASGYGANITILCEVEILNPLGLHVCFIKIRTTHKSIFINIFG